MDFGIPTITVVGEGISDGRSEAHAWNYVYIDGKWYGLDATFDDPIIRGGGTITEERKIIIFLLIFSFPIFLATIITAQIRITIIFCINVLTS